MLHLSIAILGGMLFWGTIVIYLNYDLDDEESKPYWNYLKKGCIGFAVLILLNVFVPTQKTLVAMMITQNITKADADEVVGITGKIANDVINALKEDKK